jgi:rubrerythrin
MLKDPTPRKAIEFAVKTEEAGAIFYRKIARRFADDKEIHDIFINLAEDEDRHKAQFEKLMERVPPEFAYKSQRERLAVLRATSMSEFFLGEDGIFRNLELIKSREDALKRALRLEQDTLSYYQAIRDLIGKNSTVDAMIQAEKNHIATLLSRMDWISVF